MIRIRSSRVKGGEHFDQGVRSVSVGRALQSLLRFELGFGGVVSKVGRGVSGNGVLELVVVTHVFGCVDTTYFSGGFGGEGDKEMEMLVGAAWLYCQSREDRFEADVGELVRNTGGSPLLITACGPKVCELFGGVPYSRIIGAYVVLGGVEKVCREFLGLKEEDFWVALELVCDGAGMEEVLGVAV